MDANSIFIGIGNVSEANKWNLVRYYRDKLLAQSDFTQFPDAVLSISEKLAWMDYRQALRDIPQNYTDPDLVEFPEVAL